MLAVRLHHADRRARRHFREESYQRAGADDHRILVVIG
jgi:hypothetical protein